jgi:hypothetical protein
MLHLDVLKPHLAMQLASLPTTLVIADTEHFQLHAKPQTARLPSRPTSKRTTRYVLITACREALQNAYCSPTCCYFRGVHNNCRQCIILHAIFKLPLLLLLGKQMQACW